MAKTSTLTDAFATINTGVWNISTTAGGSVTSVGGGAKCTYSTAAFDIAGLASIGTTWDLTNSYVLVEIPDPGPLQTGWNAQMTITGAGTSNTMRMTVSTGGGVKAQIFNAGSTAFDGSGVTWNATTHRWLRIREAAGTVFFETAPDGLTWVNQYSTSSSTPSWSLTSVQVSLYAQRDTTNASPGYTTFDNFNLAPAAAASPQGNFFRFFTSYSTGLPGDVTGGGSPTTRDPFQQPFVSTSIWNQPIGSGAVYQPCNYVSNPRNESFMPVPYSDFMLICLTPNAPPTTIRYSSVGWSGNRCVVTNDVPVWETDPIATGVPIPFDFVVPGNVTWNSCSAFLMADGHTLLQTQPFARCSPGSIPTSLTQFPGNPAIGGPPREDLYGTGIYGMQGGSRLSSLGGTIRLGEMRPGQIGIPHAIKLEVDAVHTLKRPSSLADAFRWPAFSADSSWASYYGLGTPGPSGAKMGCLLAIPASVNINTIGIETAPGLQLAWTLQNYGGYVCDNIGASGWATSTEEGYHGSFLAQFQSDWGFPFEQRQSDNSPWVRDWIRCYTRFAVVDNNSPTSIGGGGTPLVPLAPPLPPSP